MKIEKIKTQDYLGLHSLSFGTIENSTCYIVVHGLGSSLWSHVELADELVTNTSSVLLFNNRGFGIMNTIKSTHLVTGIKERKICGAAFEVFEESVFDIEGAIQLAKEQGAKEIVLIGFSTGSNKIIHYLKKNNQGIIKKAILASPLSDYLDAVKQTSKSTVDEVVQKATSITSENKDLISFLGSYWSKQRILSLFSSDSIEQCFKYHMPNSKYSTFITISTKLKFIIGEKDECADRPIQEIQNWFERNKKPNDTVTIIPDATHSLKGFEMQLAHIIQA